MLSDYDPIERRYVSTPVCFLLKVLITLSTAIVVILQFNFYYVLSRIENTKWGFPNFWSSLFDTSLFKKAAIEIII